ncbi:MAG TPA: copper homeostasis membrane protein CopD [Steroidobacteraceae bacterium]
MQSLMAATRAVHFAALIALFGEFVFLIWVADATVRGDEWAALAQRAVRMAGWSITVAVLSGVLWLGLEAAEMSGAGAAAAWDGPTLGMVIIDTRFGHAWSVRLVLALAIALVLTLARATIGRSRPLARTVALLSGVLLATVAWAGHAAGERGTDRIVHLSADAMHLAAAGAWLGALPSFASLLANASKASTPEFAGIAARRFSTLGVVSVGTLVITGIVNAWYTVGSMPALVATPYGRLLLLKLLLFGAMLALAAINRLWLTRRLTAGRDAWAARQLQRNAIAETALGVAVLAVVGVLGITTSAAHVYAEPMSGHARAAFGRTADPREATRTIRIEMGDDMRFMPADIRVKRGEVVRFLVENKGKLMHEMVLGTLDELQAHAAMMGQHPDMEHDAQPAPNELQVGPGKSGELGWQFTAAGAFYYGCLVPGHLEAGMIGKVLVTN